jgi:methyl-accepting chemotaxis protein
MAAALESLRFESGQVTDAARQSGASAASAGGALGETLHELDAVRAGVEDCAERVRALEDVARELRAVRTLVEDVGELGKMLSLNVAIQASVDSAASRALGAFSDEVQRLATRARSAVTQVEAIHQELRGEAERAASAVKESVWRARSAAERARGARGALDELAGTSRRLEDLNHALGRAQREHAVNVTDVVKAVTAMHALTREVREQVDATADSAAAFGEAAAGLERRLAAPPDDAVIEMDAQRSDDGGEAEDTGAGEAQRTASSPRALGRWT